MQEYLFLGLGIFILIFTIYDFFYTTLSGSGAGVIAEYVSIFANNVVQFMVKIFGRSVYKIQGLFVNLLVLAIWVLLIWFGLFLLYSWNPGAITNSNGRAANIIERLYYTGYVLSTLGIGNFKPTTEFFELVTSLFSFFGFIFFTSSMTYFISVSSALVNKRTLAKSIFNLGKSPQEIASKLLSMDSSYSYQQLLALQEMINRHSVNHQAYPVIHFYTEAKSRNTLSLNITRFDEALSILINSDEGGGLQQELTPVRSSIDCFIENLENNFKKSMPSIKESIDRSMFSYEGKVLNHEVLEDRRQFFEKLLKSEGLTWSNVLKNN